MQIKGNQHGVIPKVKVKYCLYARKSTESDEQQALSIDSQIKEMTTLAEREGLIIRGTKKESHSAKDVGERPVFNELLEEIKAGKYTGIICWHPDRISRNAGDLGKVVDLMDQGFLVEIRTYSQTFTNNPNEKFLFMILGSQAKLENDTKSINIKRGLRARVEMGLWPVVAPTGYLNEKRTDKPCSVIVDPDRATVMKQIFEKVALDGWSGRRVYAWLKNEINFKTKNDKHLSLGNLYLLLKNSFYYGVFEYPRGSGNWYTGVHEPIIDKELFDRVQAQIKSQEIDKSVIKEFAFTRLIKCGHCGSGITADEKFKKLKDGSYNRHVYYICTKSRDKNCPCRPINETDLTEELLKIVDGVSLDKLGMKEKLTEELEKYSKFRSAVLGMANEDTVKQKSIDMKNYAKYILKDGTVYEKRDLLSNLRSKLSLKEKELLLEG
ncbi:MAG: Recombinase [Candidatus Magasanikbacteria bacterium GW2011_GWC2_37_14]|uniref:Recombinase n=1 Tax=Candidatus Magasanikbacteria bacterium GW2011_GWC2_37_14 TaxID=1619046 RepID=A0A0G0IRZ0_9BACT|nr:MAG: Recombinase [Candidatus Magasanikbacteria bacterium GW2011_GWC2_37_14]